MDPYDGLARDGGANDGNIEAAAQTIAMDQKPVAVGKCYGRGGWCTNSIAVFANGWLMGVGSNTAHNRMRVKLADGKVPTAIAITNSGEFALVTVWDTAAVRGQVAVVALADGSPVVRPRQGSAIGDATGAAPGACITASPAWATTSRPR